MFVTVERVNCHNLLESTISILKGDIEEKRISLTTNLTATNVWLQADARKLQQVFLNRTSLLLRLTVNKLSDTKFIEVYAKWGVRAALITSTPKLLIAALMYTRMRKLIPW